MPCSSVRENLVRGHHSPSHKHFQHYPEAPSAFTLAPSPGGGVKVEGGDAPSVEPERPSVLRNRSLTIQALVDNCGVLPLSIFAASSSRVTDN